MLRELAVKVRPAVSVGSYSDSRVESDKININVAMLYGALGTFTVSLLLHRLRRLCRNKLPELQAT